MFDEDSCASGASALSHLLIAKFALEGFYYEKAAYKYVS